MPYWGSSDSQFHGMGTVGYDTTTGSKHMMFKYYIDMCYHILVRLLFPYMQHTPLFNSIQLIKFYIFPHYKHNKSCQVQ